MRTEFIISILYCGNKVYGIQFDCEYIYDTSTGTSKDKALKNIIVPSYLFRTILGELKNKYDWTAATQLMEILQNDLGYRISINKEDMKRIINEINTVKEEKFNDYRWDARDLINTTNYYSSMLQKEVIRINIVDDVLKEADTVNFIVLERDKRKDNHEHILEEHRREIVEKNNTVY